MISIGLIRSEINPAFIYNEKKGRLGGKLALHVDNALQAGRARSGKAVAKKKEKKKVVKMSAKKGAKKSIGTIQKEKGKKLMKNKSKFRKYSKMRGDKRYISAFTDIRVGKLPVGL